MSISYIARVQLNLLFQLYFNIWQITAIFDYSLPHTVQCLYMPVIAIGISHYHTYKLSNTCLRIRAAFLNLRFDI